MKSIRSPILAWCLAAAFPILAQEVAPPSRSDGPAENPPSSSEAISARGKVVCFGDSITKRGYSPILADLLDVDTVMAGVAGNSTAQALGRMANDVLAHKPDVVVIFFGTNDLRVDAPKVHVPVSGYIRNLETMMEACATIHAQVVLCTLPPINQEVYFTRHEVATYDAAGGLPTMIADYRQAALDVAAKHDVPIVDLNQLLLKTPEWMHRDGVHPSPAGNAIIARHIAKAVQPLLEPKPSNNPAS